MTSPCGLTDGAFDRFALSGALGSATSDPNVAGAAASATVDLGRALSPTLIVVRGCPGSCPVETSEDGTTFTPAGTATQPDALLVPASGTMARYVRVSGRAQDLAALTELSAWAPQPGRPAPNNAVTIAPGTPHGEGTGDSGLETAAKIAAVVLLLMVAAGGGFLLGRRRLSR